MGFKIALSYLNTLLDTLAPENQLENLTLEGLQEHTGCFQ